MLISNFLKHHLQKSIFLNGEYLSIGQFKITCQNHFVKKDAINAYRFQVVKTKNYF